MSHEPLQEPSVLDYVKSLLSRRALRIEVPRPPADEPPTAAPAPPRDWPWRTLLAAGLALAAQRAWEPPAREGWLGLILLLAALFLLGWAVRRGEWRLAEGAPDRREPDPLDVRPAPLLASLVLALAAFFAFAYSQNLFTPLNLGLWVSALGLFTWAVWRRDPGARPLADRLADLFGRAEWRLPVTRWGLLVAAVTALAFFFRLYQLDGIPAEPFSDHAEKLLDVLDITKGAAHIFFQRNTGREAIQFYWTVLVARVFGTGLSFYTLKLGTALLGLLTLPFMYLLGKELGGRRAGLLALLLTGIGYWPNVISRVGLRFPLYPLFTAATLYFLLRGLRRQSRNDLLLAGLALGLGLHGYSPFRIVALVVLVGVILYLLHRVSRGARAQTAWQVVLLVFAALMVFLPLFAYLLYDPLGFAYRTITRLTGLEAPLPGSPVAIFLSNSWNALRMFNWDNGEIWVHSVAHRPALDVVSGALFLLGAGLLLARYLRARRWQDLFLLASIPLLLMPSSLALAFPTENPALNRAGGALVPAFLIAALALDSLIGAVQSAPGGLTGRRLGWGIALVLVFFASVQNYDLVFRQYAEVYRLTSWNSSDMGRVIGQFVDTYDAPDNVWIVPYPHWVDTRLPAVSIGLPGRDLALWPADLARSQQAAGPRLFLLKSEDLASVQTLIQMYPSGALSTFASDIPGHSFLIYFVPALEGAP